VDARRWGAAERWVGRVAYLTRFSERYGIYDYE
jgi:hypothetical protein